MVLRFENKNTGNIIAFDTEKKIYEWCGYYSGKILRGENQYMMTTLIYVVNELQLKHIEEELIESGYKKLWIENNYKNF